jgi:alanine racemase
VQVARALEPADALAVATLPEALELRRAGIGKPVALLGGILDGDELYRAVEQDIQPVIHDFHQLELLESASCAGTASVWLKLDTGMHRLGFPPEAVPAVARRLAAMAGLRVQGWMTHFASADDPGNPLTGRQVGTFMRALDGVGGARSLANSAGIVAWPESHADWVRPGIMLYGGSPITGRRADALGLRPVMTLRSRVLSIRKLPAGEAVGYGGRWTASGPARIGVLSIGYGDGYPRHAPDGTPVLVGGHVVPLAGRVSMDMATVDLSGRDDVRVGDEAVMWGDGLPADEVAGFAGTIAYELFCRLTPRVRREYLAAA